MKLLLIINFIIIGFAGNAAKSDSLFSFHFKNESFSVFCETVKQETGIAVYYKTAWVKDLKVNIDADNITVKAALESVLKGTNLQISYWNHTYILLPGEKLPDHLPPFERLKQTTTVSETEKSLTESEERYLTGRKPDIVQTIQVGKKGISQTNSKVTIRARVSDQQNGEPIYGATMYLEETKSGTATDQDGYLTMILKPGGYTAVFSFMGMETRKYKLDVLSDGDFSVEMKSSVIQMAEVVVYGDKQMNIRFKDPGLEKISAKSIKEIPMLMGERDILGVSEMMPGIVSVGEGSAGLYVRGGNFDQNAFYMNNIPIYNTSHLFGFFPAFNADIINDFSIYKGHIPAQYGGRLSSVFDINARQGNRKRFTARGSLSPVAAGIAVEAPLVKDVSSFLLSARFLYSDWILKKIDDPDIRTSQADFSDFSFSWNYDFKKSQISVFAYYSQDNFHLSDLTSYDYSNRGLSASFSQNFNPRLRGVFSLTGGQYNFNTIDEQDPNTAYQHGYTIGNYSFTADFTYALNIRNTLEFGTSTNNYQLDRGVVTPFGESSLRIPVNLGQQQGMENAIYLSDSYDVLSWMNITAGLRFTIFNPLGPRSVYLYNSGAPKDERYIYDTLQFEKRQIIKWYYEPDVRLAINLKTDEKGSVKIAFNQMHQNLFMLNNTLALAPNAQWTLAEYYLEPAKSSQVSAGIFRTFPKSAWEASVEFYYKKTIRYPEFVDGANFLDNPNVESTFLPGKQDAYGVEFLVKRSGRRLEGWLSYTYSKATVRVNGPQIWERINNGKIYPANYNIPNVLNTVVNYHFSRRITASGVITYQSGRPVTYPVSVYYVDGIPQVDYSDRNAYQIPDYFRLDLSLTIEGNLRKNKFIHNSFIFSLYNVTGRDNPYSVYFVLTDGHIQSYQYSVISVPIFTATWLFKLGNYASD